MDLIFVANMWYYCRCKNHNLNRTILQFHHSKQVVADLLYDTWKPWLPQIPIIFTLNTLGAMASPITFASKKTHTHTLLILYKYQLLLAAQRLVWCCAPTICYVCRILRSLLGFCYPSPNLRHDLDLQILYCLVLYCFAPPFVGNIGSHYHNLILQGCNIGAQKSPIWFNPP